MQTIEHCSRCNTTTNHLQQIDGMYCQKCWNKKNVFKIHLKKLYCPNCKKIMEYKNTIIGWECSKCKGYEFLEINRILDIHKIEGLHND